MNRTSTLNVALEAKVLSKAHKRLSSVFEKKLNTKFLWVEHRFVDQEDCTRVYATTTLFQYGSGGAPHFILWPE
jgi:hypothetical protein